MAALLPRRLITRQRLAIGTLIVASVSLLQLISLEVWILGSLWPIGLLWAACGWTGLGANIATAFAMFCLGLWLDLLTGAALGTWAFIGVATLGLSLLSAHFLGTGSARPVVNAAITGLIMLAVMFALAIWQNNGFDLLNMVMQTAVAIALYELVSKWFELSEDEA
jgi:hypothetical protein